MTKPCLRTSWMAALLAAVLAQVPLASLARTKPPPAGSPEAMCPLFKRNPNGTWSPKGEVTLSTPDGPIDLSPKQSFARDVQYMGFEIANYLDDFCPGKPRR